MARKQIIRYDRTTGLPFWQKTLKTRSPAVSQPKNWYTQRPQSGCRSID
ncbi:hypothetical protein [Microcoleus sp. S28C3]